MNLIYGAAGFAVGFFVGIGAALFFLRWKMKRQLGMMQDNMEDLMDLTGDMEGMAQDLEEADIEEKDE